MKISLMDVREAMKDERFRKELPSSYDDDIKKYLKDVSCPCNVALYKKVAKECKEQLKKYFPGKEDYDPSIEDKNNWKVINCHINDLEKELKKMSVGRKQLAVSRYQDQVTVIVNEID